MAEASLKKEEQDNRTGVDLSMAAACGHAPLPMVVGSPGASMRAARGSRLTERAVVNVGQPCKSNSRRPGIRANDLGRQEGRKQEKERKQKEKQREGPLQWPWLMRGCFGTARVLLFHFGHKPGNP